MNRLLGTFSLLLSFAGISCANEIKDTPEVDLIVSVTVSKNHLNIEINPEFRKKYLLGNFFAKYPKDIDLEKLDYSIQIMPFTMNVVSIVWISGHDYYIDSMDEELYYSLEKIKEIFKRMYPKTAWKGNLIPRKLVKNIPLADINNDDVILLYSGGIDSTASSFYHAGQKQLLLTVWGHWDLPLEDKKLKKRRKKELSAFGKQYGHDNAFIKSNYYSFLNRKVLDNLSREISSWRIFTVEGIGWAGLAAPIMLLRSYPVLLHGSTISWDYNFPAAANPFIDDNIRFAGVGVKHDLFDMNRLQKCEYITNYCTTHNLTPPFIRVCEERIAENCCKCQKCLRTILEFAIIGVDPTPYGFPIAVDSVLKRSRSFMAEHTTGSTTVWHFMHMQNKLREKQQRGESIPTDLEWVLNVDLKKKITTDIKNQRRLDWSSLHDFLPELPIPDPLEKAF